jgi:hypothetical protein
MLYRGSFDGGCFCGAVRYRFADVFDAGYCHCTLCRRSSGAALMAFANTPASGFHVMAGTPRFVATSAEFERAFCGGCGTVMFTRSIDPARWDMVSVHLGTIDHGALIEPAMHLCHADRLPWLHVADALPRFDHANPPPPASCAAARAAALREA